MYVFTSELDFVFGISIKTAVIFEFPNFIFWENEHKDRLFYETDLEKDKIFILLNLNLGHLKSF